jgi:bifunctional DNA-binding transcriptional regulator/antitoxin component of YhaV-PrlF toxin-antitoxin module
MIEHAEFRGKFFIKIRKDGTILLPSKLNWNPGDVLELSEYGFAGKAILSHLQNEGYMRRTMAEREKETPE